MDWLAVFATAVCCAVKDFPKLALLTLPIISLNKYCKNRLIATLKASMIVLIPQLIKYLRNICLH
jgi:hypothetical protein